MLGAGTRNGTIPKRSMFSNHGRLPGTEAARSPHIHHPSSVTMVDCLVLKLRSRPASSTASSVTMVDCLVLKRQRQYEGCHAGSVTMVDCLVLKLMHPKTAHELGRCISKYRKICLVFLFLRPARPFSDQALGSPQASIPALTAVWIHYSNVFVKQVNCLENSIPPL